MCMLTDIKLPIKEMFTLYIAHRRDGWISGREASITIIIYIILYIIGVDVCVYYRPPFTVI